MTSLYDFSAVDINGEDQSLAAYRGKVVLVVNTASRCGFTPQYAGLEQLYQSLREEGLVVLAFPCNQFGGQEPGTAEQIQSFCETKFGVGFPMFEKLTTQPGPGQSPVYGFLTAGGDVPDWNFCKYLVGKDGRVLGFYKSAVSPKDPALNAAIEAALGT